MTVIVIGLLIPLLGTMLGSAFVFLMRDEMSVRMQKWLLGFASGVMVAASVWSLLIPSMEMEASSGKWSVVPAAVGFLLGMGFLLLIDVLTPHLHIGTDKPEGLRAHLSRTAMLALAVTIHNLPEGMAVGVVFAGASSGATTITITSALAVAVGIAIQVGLGGAAQAAEEIAVGLRHIGSDQDVVFPGGELQQFTCILLHAGEKLGEVADGIGNVLDGRGGVLGLLPLECHGHGARFVHLLVEFVEAAGKQKGRH